MDRTQEGHTGNFRPFSIFVWLSLSVGIGPAPGPDVYAQVRRPLVTASTEILEGRVALKINHRPVAPLIYALTDVPGGRWSWEEVPRHTLTTFCDVGVRLFQVDLALDQVWSSDGTIDARIVQKQVGGVLEVCPDAAVFIRFHVTPPRWWMNLHPEENTVYADTAALPDYGWGLQRRIEDDVDAPTRTSLASERWKEDAAPRFRELLQKLESLPEAGSIAGIQVAGGIYGEWHYWGFIRNEPDLSRPMQTYFRNWLREKYGSEKALQAAWNKPGLTFEQVRIPNLEERQTTRAGVFRDPAVERNVIDYYEAQHQVVADDILFFCRIVKETWSRPIVTGAFYGYFYSVFGREASGGHLALQRVLSSPHIDYLSGPAAYYPEANELGDPYRSRSLLTSIRLHGKLWLDEMDQQPPLKHFRSSLYEQSVRESIAHVRRNVLFALANGQGLWFYDFGPAGFNGGERLTNHGTAGWWDDPYLMEEIGRLKSLFDSTLVRPYKSGADVLLVHDTAVFYATASLNASNSVSHLANNWLPVGLFRSGAAFDPVHIDDLDRIDLSGYKTILFANTFLLTPKQRNFIRTHVERDDRHLVWVYAPGYNDGESLDVRNVASVTGMAIQRIRPAGIPRIVVPGFADSTITIDVFGGQVDPVFAVNDSKATVLGTYENSALPAVARKNEEHHTSWFIALPPADERFWSALFKQTGSHLYTTGDEIIYAGMGLIVVHTKTPGLHTVTLRNGKTVKLESETAATFLLDAETGDYLLK